ncbi:hypothetical protein [Comamonas sp. Y33R10-2]|uniref:hypothetical protein n=1 Tax=Comamonas sp. Y33R10-2 TaxID=2853257 RepID=UPI002103DD2D|nr:hypothetical protein [Comamonas sp. Y33R10-2]
MFSDQTAKLARPISVATNASITRSCLLRAGLICAVLATSVGGASARMRGNERLGVADVSIVERATGRVLPLYAFEGELWVAGRPGANYAVRVRSLEDRRIMAVVSVDGVNAVNGKTASSRAENGYVLSAADSYDVTGWRKSNESVAAFYFSQSDMSYASRTGRPKDVGVIGVALYREKLPEPVAYEGPIYESQSTAKARADSSAVAADEAAPNAANKSSTAKRAPAATPSLGTGHGAVENSQVSQTEFEADTRSPRRVVRIRYDSYENLVAKGVIREPRPRPPVTRSPSPFPADNGFVPDPPRN